MRIESKGCRGKTFTVQEREIKTTTKKNKTRMSSALIEMYI